MKTRRRKNLILLLLVMGFASVSYAQEKPMLRKRALIIAEQNPAVRALYELNGGVYQNCIEKIVLKPCETDYVTCVEDAWLVEFLLGSVCGIEHDGRLGVRVLLNSKTGKTISTFPEEEYFFNKNYCQDDFDCLCFVDESQENRQCLNFIYSQISNHKSTIDGICQKNTCVAKP